jgi:hypothetical protein
MAGWGTLSTEGNKDQILVGTSDEHCSASGEYNCRRSALRDGELRRRRREILVVQDVWK